MATWGEVLRAVQESAEQRGSLGPDLDGIRLGYIDALRTISGRAVIVYASGWLGKSGFSDPALTVEPDDVHALMECCNGVEERDLDLIIHSPGGSAEAAEQMLNYLRTQFDSPSPRDSDSRRLTQFCVTLTAQRRRSQTMWRCCRHGRPSCAATPGDYWSSAPSRSSSRRRSSLVVENHLGRRKVRAIQPIVLQAAQGAGSEQ